MLAPPLLMPIHHSLQDTSLNVLILEQLNSHLKGGHPLVILTPYIHNANVILLFMGLPIPFIMVSVLVLTSSPDQLIEGRHDVISNLP